MMSFLIAPSIRLYQLTVGLCLVLMLVFSWCAIGTVHASTDRVNARDYTAFWWWGGVKKQAVIDSAQRLYLLQGEISPWSAQKKLQYALKTNRPLSDIEADSSEFLPQGFATPRYFSAELVLVYRATTLSWSPKMIPILIAQARRWQAKGNRVIGIQIDFDVRTQAFAQYVDFLTQVRQALPADLRLSITGLMDWASHADSASLLRLKGVVDEVVVQTYQGRQTIPNYAQYLGQLKRLTVPFKIGIVQQGVWQPPAYLAELKYFSGYVVFLVNE